MAYPEQVDRFSDKLNKKTDGSVYVIEEAMPITLGKYEGLLAHDNISNSSIRVYTGSKLTGEEIINYIVSVPSETPWRRHIKIFATVNKVYVTYETPGDTVEAGDINELQDALTATQGEVERYKEANDEAVAALNANLTTHKADKNNPHQVTVSQIGAETPAGAQAKADAAKTAAINTAASDATTKANTVQTNLNIHAANITDAHNVANRLESVRTSLLTYIDQSIAAIVNGAPEMLDTLYELSNALGNDPNFSATITNLIGQKLAASEIVTTATANKVLRLDASGKFPATVITQTATYRFVTDTEKAAWVTQSQLEAAGYGDMLKSVYDADNDGKVDAAKTAEGVPWTGVSGKPSSFTPSTHTHTVLSASADNYKDAIALPSTYDRGITVFFSNNPANKFNGVAYATIMTIKGYSNMACVQYIYPYNVDAPISYRYALYNSDSWLPWRTLLTNSDVLPVTGVTWNQLKGV